MKATKTWILITLLLISATNVLAWPVPDTGQTKCYNNTDEINCPNPGEAFYGQDGNYTINPPSYTKLDSSGNALPDSANSWVMVRDNVTGLIWENKTSDGSIHDESKTFTWCDTNSATNGGNQGTCGTGTGTAATDTAAYIKALNDASFGGFSDWRMPNLKELGSIRDWGKINPAINTAWFFSTVSSHYWSSTSGGNAWAVFFGSGEVYPLSVPVYSLDKGYFYAARAVRSGQSGSLDHLVINGDGTVTDTDTGLMWQQGPSSPVAMTWMAALSYAEGLTLAGYDDWRLPTVKELQSIVDYNHSIPAIDAAIFPGTMSFPYWTSTHDAYDSAPRYDYAWCIDFYGGAVVSCNDTYAYDVRAVRGGQVQTFRSLVISKSGTGTGAITANTGTIGWSGNTGTVSYNNGTSVTLTALPDSGSTFSSWTGCDSTSSNTCTVAMSTAKNVTATFAVSCSYSLSSTSNSFTASSSGGSVGVTATSGCSWTAVSNAGWVTVTAGSAGTGNGTISYSVSANTGTSSRSGTMTIAGQTFTLTQAGAVASCSYNFNNWFQTMTIGDGSALTMSTVMTPSSSSCSWSATTNSPSWIHISTGANYTGTATVTYTIDANNTGAERTGTITIASQTGTVIQKSATAYYTLTTSKSGAGSGTITSSPSGINCGSTCSASYSAGTSVALTATPASGSTFSSWSGCDSTSSNICTVTMTTAKNVTATFSLASSTTTPTVTTSPTLSITATSATLTGIVNPKGGATTYYFQYGTTSNYDQNTTSVILAAGSTAQSVQATVSGLKSNTTYYCQIVATNSAGTSVGNGITFKTLPGANTRTMKAIIVAGGSPSPSNNIWEATKKAANNAYNALLDQGIDKTRIRYLSQSMYDADGDGTSDVNDLATGSNLEYAVTNWASTDTEDVLLYLVDHGIRGYFVIKEGEYVSALELKSWLDTLQQYISGRVIVIYDACYAGSFIPILKPPTGKERIIAASTGMEAQAAFITNGTLSFSNLFWNEIRNGYKFYDAFISAKRSMAYIYQYQMAQIDSNGNGTADEKEDTTLAGSIQIGNEIGTGAPPPTIGSASPTQNISGTSALIYADNVTATAGIQRVWAVVTPPNYSGNSTGAAVTDLPTFDLEKTGTTHYEKTYSGFTVSGTYNITIFAMDDTFLVSQPVSTQVMVTASVGIPGDLDGDGAVTVVDAVIALQIMAGMQPANLRTDFATSGADIDGDGKITQSELLYILQKTAGAR